MKRMLAAVAAALPLVAFPTAAPAGGGCAHGAGASEGKATTIVADQNCFAPTIAWAPVGSTVTWINKDPIEHTVTGPGFKIDSGNMARAAVYRVRFAKPGVYPYMCVLHPGMAAAVVVGEPKAPDALRAALEPGGGVPADYAPSAPPADLDDAGTVSSRTDGAGGSGGSAGTYAGVAALAGATLGSIGFVFGRRRREAAT